MERSSAAKPLCVEQMYKLYAYYVVRFIYLFTYLFISQSDVFHLLILPVSV